MKTIYALTLILLGLGLSSCEDPVAFDYIPQYAVEAYLLVDDPIEGIMITKSQPVADSFVYENGIVNDADVKIIANQKDTFQLQFRNSDRGGEYFTNGDYTVQPETQYDLIVKTKDGATITGTTITPKRISWIKPPRSILQYPVDTINLISPDSLSITWTPLSEIKEYLIAFTCMDTLGYGTYLQPATEEPNRKITRFFGRNSDNPRLRNTTLYGFLPGTKAPTVWTAFRWFGKHRITIYAPDPNFVKWFKAGWSGNQYDYRLSSVQGGLGVFASGSYIEQEIFLIKNQQ